MSEQALSDRHLLVLKPGRAERHYWRDLWAYRELFAILAWRDVAVRYKQTVIGVVWAVVRPFLTMVVFTVVFGRLAKFPSAGGVPYPVMVFAGMLPWFLFSTILSEASNSLLGNANLVGKVYFPRLIIPPSSAVVALVDFAINLAILLGLMVWYGFWPSWHIVLLPTLVALAMLASLGPACLITALNVKYRDFRYITPFIVQFGLGISPVGFRARSCPKAGGSSTASTRSSASSTASARACSAAKIGSTFRGSYSASALSLCSCGSASPISGIPSAALPI
jgi:lipopolysaccharide transport system permease protein